MLDKLKALWSVFQTGQTVADKQKWRTHQISANAIAAFLFAIVQLAKAWGYDFGIDMQTCADVSIGLLALVNVGVTVATSKGHGLPPPSVREAEQTVPSVQSADAAIETSDKPASLPHVDEAPVGQSTVDTIDEATRQRAIEWAKLHSVIKPSINNSNGLASDA